VIHTCRDKMATGRYTKVAALIIRWTEELDMQALGHSDEVDYR
jgi:hypothetical protein